MIRVNPSILTTLRHRFDEQVFEADILDWLYNFEEQDWWVALTLLNQVTFYSEHRMSEILEDGLTNIKGNNPQEKIIICPIGGIGKSGGVMAYMVKKLMGRICKGGWAFYDENTEISKKPVKVVMLDDFVGTGGSALKLYGELTGKMPVGSKYYCLCVACMERGSTRLEGKGIEVYGDRHKPAFACRQSVFGYPPKMKPIKAFAEKYGSLLYPQKPYIKGMDLYIGPLGYGNCQALVTFDHTTPNNSLPILWESKWRSDRHERWKPLFPRRLYDRTKRQDDFERRKYHWLSIAMKLTAGQVVRPFNDYSREATLLLGLLFCKVQRRSDAYICVMLEVTQQVLKSISLKAKSWGLFDNKGNVTEAGRQLYKRIRKEESKKMDFVTIMPEANYVAKPYIPKQFLGISRYKTISEESKNNEFEIITAPWL